MWWVLSGKENVVYLGTKNRSRQQHWGSGMWCDVMRWCVCMWGFWRQSYEPPGQWRAHALNNHESVDISYIVGSGPRTSSRWGTQPGGCRPTAMGQCELGKEGPSQPLELSFSTMFRHHMYKCQAHTGHFCGLPKLCTIPGVVTTFPLQLVVQ